MRGPAVRSTAGLHMRQGLFHLFKVSINNIIVIIVGRSLARGIRTGTGSRTCCSLILRGLSIHQLSQFMGSLGQCLGGGLDGVKVIAFQGLF